MKKNGSMRVVDVVAALESGDEEELLAAGGIEKNHRPAQQPDARPGRNKTPRRQDQEFLEGLPAGIRRPVVVLPEEKKRCEMQDNNSTVAPVTPTKFDFEICPVCAFFNKAANRTTERGVIKYLVCKGDNDRYLAYAKEVADQLAGGQKPEVLSKVEWVLFQLDLGRFERELEAARKKREGAPERIEEKVRVATNGKSLPREVFTALRAKVQQEVSNEDYFLVRRLNARLQAATKLKADLEQVLAEKAANEAAGKVVTCNPTPVATPVPPAEAAPAAAQIAEAAATAPTTPPAPVPDPVTS